VTIVINLHALWWILPLIVTLILFICLIVVAVQDYSEGGMLQGTATVLVFIVCFGLSSFAWLIGVIYR
jgi:hypothetical protein